ncbi:intraflagellar transport protein 52-like protein [Sarcoptes scabiei]|uniref:Intraflagellar transport protein 52-like protein n=1 Tax=Sarcoptes scabiei TaxID=52283 RepID=A0A132AL22_SARSC|nr:intraflagellar transport protein 52-like protein [Sarcoptes scabiei]
MLVMPKSKYSDVEFKSLKSFLENGGKILILLEDGGERKSNHNVNYFIEEYGISVNNDKVIRSSFYKYYDPKEALIQDGIINRSVINQAVQKNLWEQTTSKTLSYLFVSGATLNVMKPSIPIMSTGKICLPACRPTCSFYEHDKQHGRLIVFGSGHSFTDRFLNKEDNSILFNLLLDFLCDPQFKPNQIDSLNPEINDYHCVPDLNILCNNPIMYLEESEELPMDYSKLFSKKIKKISNRHLTKINETFEEMQIEKQSLQVIKPHFETPLPRLQPAVYLPVFRAHSKPELELFDLDNEFASIQSKLTKLANKCNNTDIEYFIRESGMIMGLKFDHRPLEEINQTPINQEQICKSILYAAVSKIIQYKKINND